MKTLLFSVFAFISVISFSQSTTGVRSDFATKKSRDQMRKKMVDTSIYLNLKLPLADSTEGEWIDGFWAMELFHIKNDFTKNKVAEGWKHAADLSEDFQTNLLEVSFSLFPDVFKNEAFKLMQTTESIPVFVIASEYITNAGATKEEKETITEMLGKKFLDVNDNRLTILGWRLEENDNEVLTPPLQDIFDRDFLPGQTIIYSLQRKNRNFPGAVIIRKPDGSFARNADGKLFSVPQLAKAITGFPFYVTNGNTPQGIYRWTGSEVSKLKLIGPSPNIQMVMPVEAQPFVYFNDSSLINVPWTKDLYSHLLPVSWKNYEGIYEAFYAGSVGRYAIIMHGTTVDGNYYQKETFFPQTPTLGCLCSYEQWDDSGKRVQSQMQDIVDKTKQLNASKGYVVVIDIDNENRPVKAYDVLDAVEKSELRSKTK